MASQELHNQQGFTLIEVMIALVVLVIGVVGTFTLQLLTIKGNSNAIAISRSVQESNAALDMAESLNFSDAELTAGNNKNMLTLFGGAQNFSGTVTYNVVDLGAVQLATTFSLQHDNFPGVEAKQITINSKQRVAGTDKTISLQYIKIDY